MEIQSPKGTRDMLPKEAAAWQNIEAVMREEAARSGYLEIRTPVFEHTELFARGVGDTTDIVQKEMYTFLDKGNRSITLKPEGTAGVVRALIEHRLYAEPLPVKVYYLNNPIFRYENPQHGRLREHHQFGMECFGAASPSADAELVDTILRILARLGMQDLDVHINSIGCPVCRPAYHQTLIVFLKDRQGELCKNCQERLEKNPLRVLDCKEDQCQQVTRDAPSILDHLCGECEDHFAHFQDLLQAQGLSYQINPRIVRGLDYYTKTVFEIVMDSPRGPLAMCGGGRYDGLVQELGGPHLPGVGFGIGTERILLAMESRGIPQAQEPASQVFIASLNQDVRPLASKLCSQLRKSGIPADVDHLKRSLKAQFRFADKLGVRFMVILGGDELGRGAVTLKDLREGQQSEVPLDALIQSIQNMLS